jgi:two-component system chemotaxis response regulator CheY
MINTEITILIVDDLAVMRKIITHQLKQVGFENVILASNVIEAMKMLQEEKFDLVLSAWKMPGKDGMDLLEAMRTDDALAKIPFIIIAAEDGEENVIKAINAGVTNYIVKPLSANILEDKIYEVFTGKPKATAPA